VTIHLLAHGSVDPRHAADVAGLAERLAAAVGRTVRPAYLDHCGPALADAGPQPGDVVVPLLLSPGYHVQVDVDVAVAQTGVPLRVAAPPLLTDAAAWSCDLLSELRAARPGHDVVLMTAGTRDADVLRRWDVTGQALGVPVAHASGPGRRLTDVVAAGERALVLPLLVARGFFGDMIAEQATAAGLPVSAIAGESAALLTELVRLVRDAAASAG
jgi:sirohydrochlorin ferrochelatase